MEGLPANSLNVLMVLLFCLITFTQVFQNVLKTLSFFNGEYLSEYMKKSVDNRIDMPGSAYIRKILKFNEKHAESGELCAEFLKGSCKEKDGSLCKHCCVTDGPEEITWTGPATEGTFLLSELAGRTSQLPDETGFFHRVFAEKLSPSCLLFRI